MSITLSYVVVAGTRSRATTTQENPIGGGWRGKRECRA
jgi:hypothetical protein